MSFKVIGIGEALWDLMPSGRRLGGATANFAFHARSLGATAFVISRVGQDDLGREILQRFKEMEISDGVMQVDALKPTGVVYVMLDKEGQPQFNIPEDTAWDWIESTQAARAAVHDADAVYFGSLAQRNPVAREAIQKLISIAPADALRVFDINLRQKYYSRQVIEQSLRLANVLKMNDVELPILAEMFDLGKTQREQIETLSRIFDLRVVALTCGEQGSLLYESGYWSEQPSRPIQVVDTVGAGDAFAAALTMGLLHQMDPDALHIMAAEVARFVCGQSGATPQLPDEFRAIFAESRGVAGRHSGGDLATRIYP